MKHTMRILTFLMLAIVVGTGQTWGRGGDLGYIVFDDSEVTGKGEVAFYTDAECTKEISFSGGKTGRLSSVGMNEEVDGNNLLGYTIYIKAVPNYNYTFGAADDNGAVTFITAEKTTNIFQAPRRTQSDPTLNLGPDITVKATSERFVYSFVMPASGANVTIHVNFPERTKQSVKYIDVDGELKDSPEAYFIDGSETALSVPGDASPWYVVPAGSVSYACNLPCVGNVNLIIADGATMTIGSSTTPVIDNGFYNANGSIHIYGQSEKTGKLTVFAELNGIYTINGNIDIVGCQVEATTIFEDGYGKHAILAKSGDIILKDADVTVKGYSGIATDVNSSQQQGDATETEESLFGNLTICGGKVDATAEYVGLASKKVMTLTDAVVTAVGGYYGISSESDIIINGGNVTATSTNEADGHALFVPSEGGKIEIKATETATDNNNHITVSGYEGIVSNSGSISISGFTVKATGIAYAIYASSSDITLTNATVTANGTCAIRAVGVTTGDDSSTLIGGNVNITGGTITATGTGKYEAISSKNGDIILTNADITATAENTCAIYANNGNVTINGGEVTATSTSNPDADPSANDSGNLNGENTEPASNKLYAIHSEGGNITLTDATVTAEGYRGICAVGVTTEDDTSTLIGGKLTITGGKVEATSTGGDYAISSEGGDIILGWNKTTDFIKATSYDVGDSHTVSVKYGQAFKSEDGTVGCVNTLTNDEVTAIAGLKLIPTGAHRLYTAGTTNEWMTWCCSDELLIPVQLTAYTIEGVNNGTVTLSDALTTVPAYTPVLIKRAGKSLAEDIYAAAKEEGTAPDTGYDTATGLAWTTAQGLTFWGNATDATITEGGFTANGLTAYNLYNGRFYRLKGDLNINANRCILTVDGNTNAAVLSISEEITSLTPIPSPKGEGREYFYTLDGRKLDGMPTKKGIYINGGRKVVIK